MFSHFTVLETEALGLGFVFSFKPSSHILSGPEGISVVIAGMGEMGRRMLLDGRALLNRSVPGIGLTAEIAPPFSCRGSSVRHRNADQFLKDGMRTQRLTSRGQKWLRAVILHSLCKTGHSTLLAGDGSLKSSLSGSLPRMEAPIQAACILLLLHAHCRHNGGVQLCRVCVVSPAQGNGPLGNQAQM